MSVYTVEVFSCQYVSPRYISVHFLFLPFKVIPVNLLLFNGIVLVTHKVCVFSVPHGAAFSGHDQCSSALQIGALLNLVQEFGNRRPLICDARGQRCPAPLCLFVFLSNRRLKCYSAVQAGRKQRLTGDTGVMKTWAKVGTPAEPASLL